ncbi:MAG: endonuclease/exonuclease/phosphatase family protein [Bacillota bacterium]|nr:endonuclease/exonuclease/phosphatase family protein [Bacillota bacterium]
MERRDDFHLSFLTWNIYLGADLTPLAGGLTLAAVTQVFRQFLATKFPVRAKAIAREIASKKPDLIGLQEAERWELVIPYFPIVIYDFVELLLNELEERGLHYGVAALNNNQNVQNVLDSYGNKITFMDRDVILIRKEHRLKIINIQEFNFTTSFNGFLRGWSAIDVKLDGHIFRMINTHLEPFNPETRAAQATELINDPANCNLPLIITGDLNSTPNSTPYNIFIKSSFRDVWSEVGEGSGFTCCQASNLLNAVSTLNERIDYILFRNGWKPIEAELIGESQSDRTRTGLWPSDHAGVLSKLDLEGHHHD